MQSELLELPELKVPNSRANCNNNIHNTRIFGFNYSIPVLVKIEYNTPTQ